MDISTALKLDEVRAVSAYGGQLVSVFHQYALTSDKLPINFEESTNVLGATITTLNQIAGLLKDEVEGNKDGKDQKLFSLEGTLYVQRLLTECVKSLKRIESVVIDACLPRKEFKIKVKLDEKEAARGTSTEIVYTKLKLDERVFLDKVEATSWSLAEDILVERTDRLHDIQLHLLLVFQVVTVGALSKDLTSGKVDVESIVAFHSRVIRTANLVSIGSSKPSKVSPGPRWGRFATPSDGSAPSSGSDSDSDSDASSLASSVRRMPRSVQVVGGPPPPPPAPAPSTPSAIIVIPADGPPPSLKAPMPSGNALPPAYSESHKLTTPGLTSMSIGPSIKPATSTSSWDEKLQKSTATVSLDEKRSVTDQPAKETQIVKPAVPESRLFKSSSAGLGFKLKTFFRSKESLATEMRKALCDTDSHLLAFVIQMHDLRTVPHSAFHSLESTHMKTILSQLNANTWYDNFSRLEQVEHTTLHRVVYPLVDGKVYQRELVALEVLQEGGKLNAWVALLKEILHKQPFPPRGGAKVGANRILLAIVREKLLDGKALLPPHNSNLPPPPPPPVVVAPPIVPVFRPPPLPVLSRRAYVSDLRFPGTTHFPVEPTPIRPPFGPPPPGTPSGPPHGPPFGPPGPSGTGPPRPPISEWEATNALTTYMEYTIRQQTGAYLPGSPADSGPPPPPGTTPPTPWTRCSVTQEAAEKHLISQRVAQFQRQGGNVIEARLRLTSNQSCQMARIMDDLKSTERDPRFEWAWVEVSLHSNKGEIISKLDEAEGATLLHLVAKRSLKLEGKPVLVYNSLMRGPISAPYGGGPPPPPRSPVRLPPPGFVSRPRNRQGLRKGSYSSDSNSSGSDTESDSSWDSDSSAGVGPNRRLRGYKRRKAYALNKKTRGKGKANGKKHGSGAESEEEVDPVEVKIVLKRGDDIVKKLLELWTPVESGK